MPADCGPRPGCGELIEGPVRGVRYHESSRVAHPAPARLELPGDPPGRALERDEEADPVIGNECAGHGFKKKALGERRTIVFIDEEGGLSERPHRARTWGPAGTDPGAAISFQLEGALGCRLASRGGTFNFRLYRETIRAPQVGGLSRAPCCVICRADCW